MKNDHRLAFLIAETMHSSGVRVARMKMVLRQWPDPAEVLRFIERMSPVATTTIRWSVRPPAKKYQPTNPNQLSLFEAAA